MKNSFAGKDPQCHPPFFKEGGVKLPKNCNKGERMKHFRQKGLYKNKGGSLEKGWDKTFFSKKFKNYLFENKNA